MEDTTTISEEIEHLQGMADIAISKDWAGDAIALEIRALRLQLEEVTGALNTIATVMLNRD